LRGIRAKNNFSLPCAAFKAELLNWTNSAFWLPVICRSHPSDISSSSSSSGSMIMAAGQGSASGSRTQMNPFSVY
jgi:hypothetical protein